jgi:hypothetical protein
MPPAKRATSSSKPSTAKPKAAATPKAATAKSASAGSATASSRSTRAAGAASSSRAKAAPKTAPKATTGGVTSDPRLEAAAERLRKLNERIIEAGKQTGETTLTSYEKALKAIASAVERGPGSSDIDWIAHLATSQAKFIREFTETWTSAARGMLK